MNVRIQGLMEARKVFARMPEAFRDAINDANDTTSREIVRAARANVRKRSGFLMRSINFSLDKRRGTAKVGVESGGAFYGHFLEFGTVKQSARPFMIPAVESQRGLYEQRLMANGRRVEKDLAAMGGRFL